jgi:hypothetical protein
MYTLLSIETAVQTISIVAKFLPVAASRRTCVATLDGRKLPLVDLCSTTHSALGHIHPLLSVSHLMGHT